MIIPEQTVGMEAPPSDAAEAPGLSIGFVEPPADFELPEMPADRVRFGVEFEDGRRAERDAPVGGPGDFTILAFQEGKPVHPDPATNVVLNWSSGSSSLRAP